LYLVCFVFRYVEREDEFDNQPIVEKEDQISSNINVDIVTRDQDSDEENELVFLPTIIQPDSDVLALWHQRKAQFEAAQLAQQQNANIQKDEDEIRSARIRARKELETNGTKKQRIDE
jgi:hypothetical protein